jgi:hypothetical protein
MLFRTSLENAATELAESSWALALCEYLLDEFCQPSTKIRSNVGALFGMLQGTQAPPEDEDFPQWIGAMVSRLSACKERETIKIVLTLIHQHIRLRGRRIPGLPDGLIPILSGSAPMAYAAAWALALMKHGR